MAKQQIKLPSDIEIDPQNDVEYKLLYDAMLFWHDQGQKVIAKIINRLQLDAEGKEAAKLAVLWKGYEDRWIDIATRLLPYKKPKLSSIEKTVKTEKRFVLVVPQRQIDNKTWLQQVDIDRAALPKPQIIHNVADNPDDTIDEIEYGEVND
jgi:hypothetical protein